MNEPESDYDKFNFKYAKLIKILTDENLIFMLNQYQADFIEDYARL